MTRPASRGVLALIQSACQYNCIFDCSECSPLRSSYSVVEYNKNEQQQKNTRKVFGEGSTQFTYHVLCVSVRYFYSQYLFIYLPCSLFVYSQWMVRVGIWWHAEHWLNSHACVAHILWPSIRSVGRNNEYFVLFTFFRLLNRKTIEEMNIEMF